MSSNSDYCSLKSPNQAALQIHLIRLLSICKQSSDSNNHLELTNVCLFCSECAAGLWVSLTYPP